MNEDLIIQKLIELDEKVGNLATQASLKQLDERITNALDQQMVILQRLDQERVFTIEWIRRIEKDVERIKVHLKLA